MTGKKKRVSRSRHGTQTAVQRVNVPSQTSVENLIANMTTASPTAGRQPPKKSCARCKESANCVKLLSTKVGRIEELVNTLEKITHPQNDLLNGPFITEEPQLFDHTKMLTLTSDFSNYSLDDLQNLVRMATSAIIPRSDHFVQQTSFVCNP